MKDIKTSLLREKFTIRKTDSNAQPVVALSNRIEINLPDKPVIVRAQNMHSAVRMAARIIDSYNADRDSAVRGISMNWAVLWKSATGGYEQDHNPNRWVAIYNAGRCVYTSGDHHPFFDTIEKCQISNRGEYERAIPMAEENYRQTGAHVKIQYDCNVALSVHMTQNNARFGVIVRGATKTTTFNFIVSPKPPASFSHGRCMNCAAAFLEGIQLAFMVGGNQEKLKKKIISAYSKDATKTADARRRLGHLSSEITEFEKICNVHYRPEKPDFQKIIREVK